MDAPTKAFFAAEVRGDNAMCFDCGTKDPQWASCTNGIYICLECSGRHRSIGVHLSFVQCLWMDKWKPHYLAMMQHGGNKRMADYLDEHGPKDWRKLPITQKYDIKAAVAYRQQLKELIASGAAPPPQKAAPPQQNPFAPKKKAAPAPSAFSLFDLADAAENIVDSLVTPKPSKQAAGYPDAEVKKPVRTAEQQRKMDLANAELKRLQNEASSAPLVAPAPAPVVTPAPALVATPCAVEAQKVEVKAKPAVDVWGDDMWDF